MDINKLLIDGFIGALTTFWYFIPIALIAVVLKSSWFKGRLGEYLVNRMLSRLCNSKYKIIKDITLATEDGSTQIDHIVVSQFGVFVIETKNMKGWIYGTRNQKMWTQKIYRHTSTFQNPLRQNYKHTKVLEAVLGLSENKLHSLIIFIGDSTFKTKMPENVTYAREGLKFINGFKDIVLSDTDISNIVDKLNHSKLKQGIVTNIQHVKNLRSTHSPEASKSNCPKCGSDMIVREARRGENKGNKFLGCSKYPKCKAISPIEATE